MNKHCVNPTHKGDKIKTIGWAILTALRINKSIFFLWIIISSLISILPAVTLNFYQIIISDLSSYLDGGNESIQTVLPYVIFLGIVLLANGLSGRINGDLLYMIMYDYYHLGMQELLMDSMQRVEMKKIMDKEHRDEYKAVLRRAGSLTDFMSAMCLLVSRVIGIISLLLVSLRISLLITIFSILYVIIVITLNLKLADKARLDVMRVREIERRIDYYQNLVTIPGVAKEMRIYDTKDNIIKNWDKEYEKLNELDYKRAFWLEFISFLSGLIYYLFMAVIVFFCIYRVSEKMMGVDTFLTVYMLARNISGSIKAIAYHIHDVDRGLFSLERQRRFILSIGKMEEAKEKEQKKASEDTVFDLTDVSFSYDGEKEVLHQINLQIKKGETIALVGENGSGKSTLVKLLIHLYQPTSGNMKLYGVPYAQYSNEEFQSRIGMFFQNFYIFHASFRENVGFGDVKNIEDREKIQTAINKGGATNLIKKMKKGIEHWLQRDVLQEGVILSGGEKQKVAIARSYMSDKEILIFDEPASALDPIAEMEQFNTIREKVSDRTAILISHRVGFARLADRILVMEHGRIAEDGTHEELMKQDGIYARFFNMQAEWYTKIEG